MATIKDVARRAGVTAATVSYVVRGKDGVGEETRTRVLAAIDELGYRPNLIARGLVQRRTYTLALVLVAITNPFYPEVAEEVERIARERGYHLLLCHTHGEAAIGRGYLEGLLGRMVDGLLVMSGSLDVSDILAVVPRRVPVVLVLTEEDTPAPVLPSVGVDVRRAGELAARHLVELGHRRTAVIAHLPAHRHRLAGFRDTVLASGLDLPAASIHQGDSTAESGYRAAHDVLARAKRPTAIFATNDLMALGAMEATLDGGLRVPHDLSIVGLDDIMVGAHVRPSLTTVAMPKRALVAEATALLLRRIEDADEAAASAPHIASAPCMVPPYLVIRHSTGAPPHAPRPYRPPAASGKEGYPGHVVGADE